MSYVKYDGNRLIPAPLVSINKTYDKSGDGQLIGSTFNVSLNGTIVAFMGSPKSDGSWHTGTGYPADESVISDLRLEAIQKKQRAIRDLFATEGKIFVIQAVSGTAPMSGFPRVNSIDIPEGQWYNRAPYTINLEFDELWPQKEDSFSDNIKTAHESWNIETNEGEQESTGYLSRTYRLTHSVSATGKRRQDGSGSDVREAWHEAQNWVQSRLGFDTNIALSSGVVNLPSYYGGYNKVRNESIDKREGTYAVTETWTLASGTALENFSVNTTNNIDQTETTVRLEGSVTGLEQISPGSGYPPTTTRYSNANTRFIAVSGLAFTRAQAYSGETLNTQPITVIVGRNPVAGTIDYSFEYDNRPSNLIGAAKSENISVVDTTDGGKSFAELFILDRTHGPVLQSLGTRPAFKRTLNLELVVNRPTVSGTIASIRSAFYDSNPRMNTTTSGDISNLIAAIDPSGLVDGDGRHIFTTTYSDPPQETWDFRSGRYSYTRTWTYIPSG